MTTSHDPFSARRELETQGGTVGYWSLPALQDAGLGDVSKLPYSIRVLLEAALRNARSAQAPSSKTRRSVS